MLKFIKLFSNSDLRSLIIMDGLCSHLQSSVDITMLLSDFTGEHGIRYLKKLKEVAIEGSMVSNNKIQLPFKIM